MGRPNATSRKLHLIHLVLLVAWSLHGSARAQAGGRPVATGGAATAIPAGVPAAAVTPTAAVTPPQQPAVAVQQPPVSVAPPAAVVPPGAASNVPAGVTTTTPPAGVPGGVLKAPVTPLPGGGVTTPPTTGIPPVGGAVPPTPIGALGSSPAPAGVVTPGILPPTAAATAGGPAQAQDSIPATIAAVSINQAGTTIVNAYQWSISKRFSTQAQTLALSIPATTGTATASYQLAVTKALATQTVTVAGIISIAGNAAFATPTLTYSPAPAATPTGAVVCVPPNQAPATCTFSQSWPDTSIAAAAGGVVTATLGGSTGTASYSFTGPSGATTGNCATITDTFSAGQLTGSNMQMTGNAPPAGLQLCDLGTKLFEYSITFLNMQATWCTTPIMASNTATATPTDGGTPASDTASVTIQVTGCSGTATATGAVAGEASVTVSGIRTTVVNTYSWTLEQTGGGASLTTTPSEELTIPFTTAATHTLTSAAGYVAGTVGMQNPLASTLTVTSVSVDLGGGAQTLPLSSCTTTQVVAGASTSCSFNVTAPNAPAAGSVTATVGYTPSAGNPATQASVATSYTFTSADTYNIGGSATLFIAIDASSLSTLTGGTWGGSNQAYTTSINPATGQPYTTTTTNNWSSYVRISPADAAPPTTPPGITITGSQTYSYNLIVSKLYTCVDQRTVTNTATLTPSSSSQSAVTRATAATFSVTGCNVLPTVALSNIQTFAAVTWTWSLTKTAIPTSYQIPVGTGTTAQYSVQLTRTRSTGNYAMAGQLTITNPATFPMYISSVTLMSTTGSFGTLPPACLGGSNVGGSTISGMTGPTTGVNQFGQPVGTTAGSFAIAAGAQIQCQFNISAGTGAAPQGQVYAQATTTSSYVTSTGNTAISPNFPVDFTAPTQQWDIGGCVTFSDNAVTQGSAGTWAPQMSNLPQQQRICESRTMPYAGAITPVPPTGVICNQPVSITNTASAVPEGGSTTATATATIQVIATGCVGPAPLPAQQQALAPPPVNTTAAQQLSSNPLVPTVLQPVKVVGVGGYEWSTTITSSADTRRSVSVPYNSSRTVQYTVVARRRPAFTYYVSGAITVKNTNDQAVTASTVSAQLPSGYVQAACPGGRFPVSVPAGGSITCAFNATLTDATSGAQGSVSGVATSTFGSATSAVAVPYAFDPVSANATGACAVLSDSLTSSPTLAASSVALSDNRPFSQDAKPLCTDGSYNFTAAFGPFSDASCNKFQVVAEATATPTDSAQQSGSPATSRNTLQLYVEGCPATAQSVDTLRIVVAAPFGRSMPSVRWSAETASGWLTTLKYTDTGTLTFNVSLARVESDTSRLSGSLSVTNPTAAPVSIKSAAVLADFSSSSAVGTAASTAAPSSSIDAQCKDTTLAPGATVNCSYTGTVSGGGSGSLTAEVVLSSGRVVSSNPARFELQGRTSSSRRGSSTAEEAGSSSCADIVTGLFLSPALMLPNRTAPNAVQQIKACASGSEQVSIALGPWSEDACGSYTVVLTTRVRPAATTGQLPFASLGVAKLEVTGCPLKETPFPDPTVAEGLNVSNVVRYAWRVASTSDADDPLRVPQGTAKDVSINVEVVREPGQRSVGLQGVVQVTARGTQSVNVSSVQVAVLKRLGELQVVDASCPGAASGDSDRSRPITVPARPNKLLCSFRVADLPPMDGAITPLVYASPEESAPPLPAMPTLFRVASGSAVRLGECAVLGASKSLKRAGSDVALEGQPSSKPGTALPAQPVCGSYSAPFDLTFGRFSSQQCGRYTFSASFSAKPFNTSRTSTADLQLGVEVTGCQAPVASSRGGSRTQRMSAAPDSELLADMLGEEGSSLAFGQ